MPSSVESPLPPKGLHYRITGYTRRFTPAALPPTLVITHYENCPAFWGLETSEIVNASRLQTQQSLGKTWAAVSTSSQTIHREQSRA